MEEILSKIPSYSQELGLDLRLKEDRFKWFLASILFARRISANIAKRTFMKFIEANLTTPQKILEAGWNRLVEVLDSGGYVRYDFSTATNLLQIAEKLVKEYGGDIDKVHEKASDPRDLEKKLMEFKGVGPVAVNIFLRELRGIWSKADPEPSPKALEVARRIGLAEVKKYESKLVRIYLEYCKKKKCRICPLREYCREPELK
ncbi:MAG: hypothetical protein DRN04_14825 [Thermoprotei archaeon]|mgnify:CR=1 FL=1|nr:MAG: hypothetical protein DRN04_14825 [Thermoprotei archaeon]